jgi:hypothetical protein
MPRLDDSYLTDTPEPEPSCGADGLGEASRYLPQLDFDVLDMDCNRTSRLHNIMRADVIANDQFLVICGGKFWLCI